MFKIIKNNYVMDCGIQLKKRSATKSQRKIRFICMMFTLFTLLFTFNSCGSDEEKPEEESYLEVSLTNIDFNADGMASSGEVVCEVYINTNINFRFLSIYSEVSWCRVKYNDSENILSISVLPNTTNSIRNTFVTVEGGGLSKKIAVIQEGSSDDEENPDEKNPCDYSEAPTSYPRSVKAVQKENSIVVSWNRVTDATEYNIYRNGNSTNINSLIGTTDEISFVDENPLAGKNYYRVKAVNCAGENPSSDVVECKYKTKEEEKPEEITVPSVPTGLKATRVGSGNNIEVRWEKVTGATGYKVYRSNSANGYYTLLKTISYSSWTDGSPLSGVNYYKVTAYNEAGESSKSNYASYDTTPKKLDAPTGLKASSGGSFVQISFNTVALAYQYELYRSTGANGSYTKVSATGGSSGTGYTLTDSKPLSGTSYYKVKAIPLSSLTYLTASNLSDYVSITR